MVAEDWPLSIFVFVFLFFYNFCHFFLNCQIIQNHLFKIIKYYSESLAFLCHKYGKSKSCGDTLDYKIPPEDFYEAGFDYSMPIFCYYIHQIPVVVKLVPFELFSFQYILYIVCWFFSYFLKQFFFPLLFAWINFSRRRFGMPELPRSFELGFKDKLEEVGSVLVSVWLLIFLVSRN